MPRNPTLAMGGAGGGSLPPLEAPQAPDIKLTAAAVTLENRIDWLPL